MKYKSIILCLLCLQCEGKQNLGNYFAFNKPYVNAKDPLLPDDYSPTVLDRKDLMLIQEEERLIELPYEDLDKDVANSCIVTELKHVTKSTECSCQESICSVGITSIGNDKTTGSFQYTVMTRQRSSNLATVSLLISSGTHNKTSLVPAAPTLSGVSPTNHPKPTWSWTHDQERGRGIFRYKLDDDDFSTGTTQTSGLSYTPENALTNTEHTFYVQEQGLDNNWSKSASYTIIIDTTRPEITITSTETESTYRSSITVSIEFSEEISGFEQSDVRINKGTMTHFTKEGDTLYSFDLHLEVSKTHTINIDENRLEDLAGNRNVAATEFSIDSIDWISSNNMSFDHERVNLFRGEEAKTIKLTLSPPAPADANITYRLYHSPDAVGYFSELIDLPNQGVPVLEGERQVDLLFEMPVNSTFSGRGHIVMTILGASQKKLDIGLYEADSRNFDILATGQEHSCGIDAGKIFCWGSDSQGQVGNGSASSSNVTAPERIGLSDTWTHISAGTLHTCGIEAGKLFCWGYDSRGQLGNGSASSSHVTSPERIGSSDSWTHISTGSYHTCGIDDGELFCWGSDFHGKVGNGPESSSNVTAPERIGLSNSWTHIFAGSSHTCGIDAGELFCWGSDFHGKVGNGSASSSNVTAPEKIGSSDDWTHISAGSSHTCGIDTGKLFCWGSDRQGQVGNGPASSSNVIAPERIGSSDSWTHISAGGHTCGIDDGELFCWGSDSQGQVGNGSVFSSNVTAPERIGSSDDWSDISTRDDYTCGINTGVFFCWGDTSWERDEITAPERIGSSDDWTHISAGGHTCGIDTGKLFCWGSDYRGQIGNGPASYSYVSAPERIGSSDDWTHIATGSSHTCSIDDGKLFCWGISNVSSNSSAHVNAPERIDSSNAWTHISAGRSHSCGIDAGKLFCWGHDDYGQIGNGPASSSIAPEKVGASDDWTHISAGGYHSCGIDDGKLFCWGRDSYAQLGNGSVSSSDVTAPERIGSSDAWTHISSGWLHTCGIDAGKLFCWGHDDYGQIGNGSASSSDVTAPERIGLSDSWTHISAGNSHTCGIDAGKIFCWGKNTAGQVGNDSASYSNIISPERIGLSDSWTHISAGNSHTCGIDAGKIFCWGKNTAGQVGNDSASYSNIISPERIGLSDSWTHISAGNSHTCGIDAGKIFCWGENSRGQTNILFQDSSPGI